MPRKPPTLSELQNLPRDCPLIYDNDWLRDTADDDYVFAKAHLGQANLRGLILTKDLWDNGQQYKIADGLKDFRENREIVRRASWKNIPEITVGADRFFVQPASGNANAKDTHPIASAGTDLIVREARRASPKKPLIVFVGGPLNTVASALLTDPRIGENIVALMTDLTGYNGQDQQANYIVATGCRLANFGASPLWWPQRPEPPILPPARFDGLPKSPIADEMRRVATMFWERSTRKDRPDRDDGLADGAGPMLFFAPKTWQRVRRMRVTGAFTAVEGRDDETHDYLDAVQVNFAQMRDEFFATITSALGQKTP